MGEVLKGIEQRRVLQVRKAERLTQQMVDIIETDESILLGLISIKDFDEYTFATNGSKISPLFWRMNDSALSGVNGSFL